MLPNVSMTVKLIVTTLYSGVYAAATAGNSSTAGAAGVADVSSKAS
jgi:hypothetical protein